jgi:hypothetical protein
MKLVIVCITTAFCVTCGSFGSQIINGSFEDDLNGWSVSGYNASIVSTFTASFDPFGSPVTIGPVDGAKFAVLKSGGGDPSTNFTQITQLVTVFQNETISGSFFFATSDYLQWNDAASVYLAPERDSSLSQILLASKDVAAVGNYGSMKDWELFSHQFTAAEAGTYELVVEVHDLLDCILASYIAVDNLKLQPAPEPCSLALLALGSLVFIRRK